MTFIPWNHQFWVDIDESVYGVDLSEVDKTDIEDNIDEMDVWEMYGQTFYSWKPAPGAHYSLVKGDNDEYRGYLFRRIWA